MSWDELDRRGFKLRLSELERGAVNVVVQPGQWPLPRVDHIGVALDADEFELALEAAARNDLRVQEHGGRRTFVSTGVGYRLELHPPRDWLEDLIAESDTMRLGGAAAARGRAGGEGAGPRGAPRPRPRGRGGAGRRVRGAFVPGGPQGRPELFAEQFL